MPVKFFKDMDKSSHPIIVYGYGYSFTPFGNKLESMEYVVLEHKSEHIEVDVKDLPALVAALDKAVIEAHNMVIKDNELAAKHIANAVKKAAKKEEVSK